MTLEDRRRLARELDEQVYWSIPPSNEYARKKVREAAAELAAAVALPDAPAESCEADARRYRWLRGTFVAAKAGATLSVNEELVYYETPEAGKEVVLHWYPDTPVGFYKVCASTMDEAIDKAATAFPAPPSPQGGPQETP